jgi:hypothetical protein
MTDYAIKNYHSNKKPIVAKIKAAAFVVLCFGTFGCLLATVCEVGHSLQMERIAAAQVNGEQ